MHHHYIIKKFGREEEEEKKKAIKVMGRNSNAMDAPNTP